MKYPTQERLKELFSYNSVTGVLSRKIGDGVFVPTSNTTNYYGYLRVSINNRSYYTHRIIWIITNGNINNAIDHINGNKSDNRICNLRDVTLSINSMNTKKPSNNNTGVVGVSFHTRSCTWRAEITVRGERAVLGNYKSFLDAVCVRKSHQLRHGFSKRHGT